MCHLDLDYRMDVQEWHITNSKCQDIKVKERINRCSLLRRISVGVCAVRIGSMVVANLDTKVCWPLSAQNGEATSELISYNRDIEDIVPAILPHGISTGDILKMIKIHKWPF
ncbi:hypothetical protein J6590_070423 [Homalodisca vitripennis]|nr:hypothetical protein J6590_070423 [Homalodisca vitripennis]